MFDINDFKKKVKEWMRENPKGEENDLLDFCEELVPPAQFAAYQWLIDQTLSWYRSILQSRKKELVGADDDAE